MKAEQTLGKLWLEFVHQDEGQTSGQMRPLQLYSIEKPGMKVNKASAQVGNGEPLWVLAEGETGQEQDILLPSRLTPSSPRLPVPSHLGKASQCGSPKGALAAPSLGEGESSLQGRKAEGEVCAS